MPRKLERGPNLRLRVSEDLESHDRRIEVLDAAGVVLGDLGASVSAVSWKMGTPSSGGLGMVSIDIAVERALIESIEVRGVNA